MKRSGTFRSGLRRAAWVLVPVTLLVAGFAFYLRYNRPTSSPDAVRPWAEAAFNDLVTPPPSSGSPLDPQYSLKVVGLEEISPDLSDPSSLDRILEMELLPATETFVGKFPVHTFDAAEGMTSGDMRVRVKWLATYSIRGYSGRGPSKTDFCSADTSGTPLDPSAAKSAEEEIAFRSKGSQPMFAHQKSRRLYCKFEVTGLKNPSWDFKGAYDEKTHAHLLLKQSSMTSGHEALMEGTLTNIHDRPLLLVFDLAHGEEDVFEISPLSGATIESPDFRLKIVLADGTEFVSTSRVPRYSPHPVLYKSDYLSIEAEDPVTSVVIHSAPNSIWEALSVEAICSDGRTLPSQSLTPIISPYSVSGIEESEPIRIFVFNVAQSEIKHLRVRRKPLKERFVMRVKSVPGLQQMPPNTIDLFDIPTSTVVFENPHEMQTFIANAIQFQHRTTPWPSRHSPGFPMTIEDATPRKILARYLTLPGKREAFIDSKEMTIRFNDEMQLSLPQRALESVRKVLGP